MLKMRIAVVVVFSILTFSLSTQAQEKKPGKNLVPIEENGKWGYADQTGKIVIAARFGEANNFSEGLAGVRVDNDYGYAWGYIDDTGKMLINPHFDTAGDFSEGLAAVKSQAKFGYIDKAGKMILPPQFDWASSFAEGLAAVKISDKWGYIDRTGKMIINPQYESAGDFSEGLANVKTSDKWQYINKASKVQIPARFDNADQFCAGMARVRVKGKWAYIDKLGNIVSTLPASLDLSLPAGGDAWLVEEVTSGGMRSGRTGLGITSDGDISVLDYSSKEKLSAGDLARITRAVTVAQPSSWLGSYQKGRAHDRATMRLKLERREADGTQHTYDVILGVEMPPDLVAMSGLMKSLEDYYASKRCKGAP